MSAVLHNNNRSKSIEISASWNLSEQINEAKAWLADPHNAESVRGWTLDIGFNSRLGKDIAVQGETIPLNFMQRLVELEVVLWLSIYPAFEREES